LDSSLSPAGSSPPTSPSSLTPRERENPWRSKKYNNNVPKSPTVYDWVVIGSWERWEATAEQYSFSIWEGTVHCPWRLLSHRSTDSSCTYSLFQAGCEYIFVNSLSV
jgi:hypothetical protein